MYTFKGNLSCSPIDDLLLLFKFVNSKFVLATTFCLRSREVSTSKQKISYECNTIKRLSKKFNFTIVNSDPGFIYRKETPSGNLGTSMHFKINLLKNF